MRVYCTLLAAMLCVLCFPVFPAYALKITPFKVSVPAQSTQGVTQIFRLENNSTEPAAVQVSVLTWEIQPDGTELNRDAEDEFIVFPAQLVLQPYESRAVRVQWLGDGALEREKAFRVLAEQIPVNLRDTPEAGSAVRFLLRFKAALYITPDKAQSNIELTEFTQMDDHLRLIVMNTGQRHSLLDGAILKLTMGDGRIVTLSGEQLEGMAGENIHAGNKRVFTVPLPRAAIGRVVSAHMDFESGF